MQVEVCRHALDRVPLSLIIDDSTPLLNLNYFFIRDRNAHTGERRRYEDIPVVIPESFTREWGEWCAEHGVKGKFSVVPCPAALGRIDQGLALFGRQQLESWLAMCREVIMPSFDITPEMLTHTFVLDLETMQPLPSRIWEQYEWSTLPDDEELVTAYIRRACEILVNVGLTPAGVTSPGGFAVKSKSLYARATGNAIRSLTRNPTPYFFRDIVNEPPVPVPVWYADRENGTATGEIIACTDDWTGNWTGYDPVNPSSYITADLEGGRLSAMINAGGPVVLCSHWQGFYGMHNDDRRGFHTLQTVVKRLQERDPHGEHTCWRKVSEITNYACAREMATISYSESDHKATISLDLPVRVPEFTVHVKGVSVRGVSVDGVELPEACGKRHFCSGTYLRTGDGALVAFNPAARACTIQLQTMAGV